MPRLNRKSTDRMERIEWQLNQIRANTQVLAFLALLYLIAVLVAWVGGAST